LNIIAEIEAWEELPTAEQEKGLRCRECGCRDLRVYYTRKLTDGRIRRVRVCRHCGKKLTSPEREVGG